MISCIHTGPLWIQTLNCLFCFFIHSSPLFFPLFYIWSLRIRHKYNFFILFNLRKRLCKNVKILNFLSCRNVLLPFFIYTITNWWVSLSKICHKWPNNAVTHDLRMSELQHYLVMSGHETSYSIYYIDTKCFESNLI